MSKRRGLQKRAAESLKPLGFTAISGTSFTRQVGKQLHFVGLQCNHFSSEITFNLGCHFHGLPTMFDYQPAAVDDLEDLDCGLRIRVGRYIGDGFYDVWWNPDNSEVPSALAQATWAIERAFEDCMKKWGSDGALIIRSHIKNQAGAIRLSRPLLRWMVPQRRFNRFAFVALLAHRHGEDQLASSLYGRALASDDCIPLNIPKLAATLGIGQGKNRTKSANGSGLAARRKVKRSTKS